MWVFWLFWDHHSFTVIWVGFTVFTVVFTLFSRWWFSLAKHKPSTKVICCVNHSKSSQPVLQLSPAQPPIEYRTHFVVARICIAFHTIVAKQARYLSGKIKGWHISPGYYFFKEKRKQRCQIGVLPIKGRLLHRQDLCGLDTKPHKANAGTTGCIV